MSKSDVVIAGAGPVGLMLACELHLHGVRGITVLDPLPGPNPDPRANGVSGPGVRLLDHRGLYESLSGSQQGPQPMPMSMFAALTFAVPPSPAVQNYMVLLPQPVLNRALADRADELGIDVRWGHRLTGFTDDAGGVCVDVEGSAGTYSIEAGYLVGTDGGRGVTRKLAGIQYLGMSSRDAVFRLGRGLRPVRGWSGQADVPGLELGHSSFLRTETGMFMLFSNPGETSLCLVGTLELAPAADNTHVPGEEHPGFGDPLTMAELGQSLHRVLGVDMPVEPVSTVAEVDLRRYAGINTLIAESYRKGRVLLAGDAAHVQSALGGPGLNLGLQDAANLGWKLAAVVRGEVPPDLLDTYETERRIAAEVAITVSRAQFALSRPGPEATAMCQIMAELATQPQVAQRLAQDISLGDTRYPTEPDAHPAAGQWVPDLTLTTSNEVMRIAQLCHDGRPLLLDFTAGGDVAEAALGVGAAINVVRGTPVENTVLTAILVRPDGYVGWASSESAPDTRSLDRALRRWFGLSLSPATT